MVVRWKFGEGRTKTRSLFKLQRSFQTCSSPPTTADRRRAPGRQLTVGPVLRPAGCSPPPIRSAVIRSWSAKQQWRHRSSSPPRQHTASRRLTADQSLPSSRLRVRGLKGADQQLTPDRTFCRQVHHRRPFAPIRTQSAKPRWRHRLHRRPVAPTPDSEQEGTMPTIRSPPWTTAFCRQISRRRPVV